MKQKGIVQFYLREKGYGYIRVPETREEFYVHQSQLKTPIQKGDEVVFEVEETKQGAVAVAVKKITTFL